ncbi:MAG: L-lactate dehydrogenase [Fervidobacterium sp.]
MKISIYGAGRVGVSVAFSIMHKAIADEIVIVDIDKKRAEGEALDLMHSSAMFKRCDVSATGPEGIKDSDFIVITAGRSQLPGETRLDLVEGNFRIIEKIANEILRYSPNSLIINVTNPVDVLTYFLQKLTNIPREKVIGTGTTLDTARLRVLLSKICKISPSSIHAYVIGEHGDSEFVPFSIATIGGLSLEKYCKSCSFKNEDSSKSAETCLEFKRIEEEVRRAAYKIIEKKGATNLAIGAVTSTLIESMIKDEKRVWTPSVKIDDIYIGFPAVLGRNGVERILEIELSESENEKLEYSKKIIRSTINAIQERRETFLV